MNALLKLKLATISLFRLQSDGDDDESYNITPLASNIHTYTLRQTNI